MYIYPYKVGSKSVAALKEVLGVKAIKLENSKFKGDANKIVINWGSSKMSEESLKCKVINHPDAVALVSNKLSFFERMNGQINTPEYTLDKDEAYKWLKEGKVVVARENLSGYGGKDITILDNEEGWRSYNHGNCKMYTKYIPKKDEYRVHVMGGDVIDVQKKAKRKDLHPEEVNWRVRNHDNGFVFMREGVEPPEELLKESIKAVVLCGLDFGAVDVLWNSFYKKPYVLEINTAPGLEGQTVENYVKGLQELSENMSKVKVKKGAVKYDENVLRQLRDAGLRAFDDVVAAPAPQPQMIFQDEWQALEVGHEDEEIDEDDLE